MSYGDQLRKIANDFLTEHEGVHTREEFAKWAIDTDRWRPQPEDLIRQCADQLTQAMRQEYTTDPQGRRVRTKISARMKSGGKQLNLWGDSRTAAHTFVAASAQQRRDGIFSDCRQLKWDVDSYNENRHPETAIQVSFNFEADLEEMEAAEGIGG